MPSHYNDFESQFGAGGDNLFNNAVQNQALGPLAGSGSTGTDTASIWGAGGMFGKGGTASMVLGGLETLGTLWGAFQQNKLAKKSLKFQKKAFETNLANSTQVYNTALEDRIRARYATEGRPDEANQYIQRHSLGDGGSLQSGRSDGIDPGTLRRKFDF